MIADAGAQGLIALVLFVLLMHFRCFLAPLKNDLKKTILITHCDHNNVLNIHTISFYIAFARIHSTVHIK